MKKKKKFKLSVKEIKLMWYHVEIFNNSQATFSSTVSPDYSDFLIQLYCQSSSPFSSSPSRICSPFYFPIATIQI